MSPSATEADRYADVVGIPAAVRRAALEFLEMMGDEGHWLVTTDNPRELRRVQVALTEWAAREVGTVQVVDREVVTTGTVALRLRAYLTKAGKLPEAPGWKAAASSPAARVLPFAPPVAEPEPLSRHEVSVQVTKAPVARTAVVPGKIGGNVRTGYLLKALELAKAPGGVQANDLAAAAVITPRHARRVLEALAAAGALVREAGEVPHKRSPGRAPAVYHAEEAVRP